MAKEPPATEAPAEAAVAPAPRPSRKFALKSLLSPKWLALLLLMSVLGHGLGYLVTRQGEQPQHHAREVSLGRFTFAGTALPQAKVLGADFDLHIGLLDPADAVVRARLNSHKLKLEQDIEELLRQSHGDDFVDPKLRELKRQLAEQINASLGLRAVEDVIVTDLVLQRPASVDHSAPQSPTAEPPRTASHRAH